jgi:RNA 3'-terminal phosphate cyclase (ATP)
MMTIDGAQKSGSGTIVRYAVALAALLGRPLHVINARAKRPKPGLRPQHLAAVRACAELCEATTDGLGVGSQDFTFVPGRRIHGGTFTWDIGTAGSATMLALSIVPLACFADRPVTARITGGVFQDFAPSPFHMQHVLAPLLARMGATVELEVVRAGYIPLGAGVVRLRVIPVKRALAALAMAEQGDFHQVRGIAFSSLLAERRVSTRMAQVCAERLRDVGLACQIDEVYDTEAAHAGAGLAAWAQGSTGCVLGADRAGAFRRSSEAIGRFVATTLLEDMTSGATVDRHLADQLVLFATLAQGTTTYVVPRPTEHLDSNLWLAEQYGATVAGHGHQVTIAGLGVERMH